MTDEGDKSFDPTPRKLEQAAQKGDVAQSADLVAAGGYLGFVALAMGLGGAALLPLANPLTGLLAQATPLAENAFGGTVRAAIGPWLGAIGWALLPWLLLPAAIAAVALVGQGSVTVAPERIRPKWSRISPAATFGQKFGLHGLMEFAKGLVKMALYIGVAGYYALAKLSDLLLLPRLGAAQALAQVMSLTIGLLACLVAVAVPLAVLDLLWQRFQHLQRNRMTRQEITEEYKEAEGDPVVRHERRQRGREIALSQILTEVPKATVVIVNPTHYAVALAWHVGSDAAPRLVAKGTDELAARIRETATAHGVPIHRDPPTARALYAQVRVGDQIGRAHFRAVAVAIRFAESLRSRRKGPA